MNTEQILGAVRAKCAKNREKWPLAHDIEEHYSDNFLVEVALNLIEGVEGPYDIGPEQWQEWMDETYEERLICGIALLVQEVERFSETPL